MMTVLTASVNVNQEPRIREMPCVSVPKSAAMLGWSAETRGPTYPTGQRAYADYGGGLTLTCNTNDHSAVIKGQCALLAP